MKAALVLLAAIGAGGPALADQACAPDRVDVRVKTGVQPFYVEVADDAAERSKGLMFRESMAPDQGMLFVYDAPKHAQFWMKNTLIPLDIIFADSSGVVTRVQANAEPLNETPLDGGIGVQYVLEINGGLAADLGIGAGAVLRHPAIVDGAWPCA